jgi:cobalamin-dependent methionine synthase I
MIGKAIGIIADVIAMSALLTTTMVKHREAIKQLEKKGLRGVTAGQAGTPRRNEQTPGRTAPQRLGFSQVDKSPKHAKLYPALKQTCVDNYTISDVPPSSGSAPVIPPSLMTPPAE